MNHTDAMALSQAAIDRKATELEARWETQIHEAIRGDAMLGSKESEVLVLVPPKISPKTASSAAFFVAARLEQASFRVRIRWRDQFLDDGPAIVGDMLYPRGSTMISVVFSTEWSSC